MEIRKADSKGRLTGFENDGYYLLARTPSGKLILDPLKPDSDIDVPLPVNPETLSYLESLGISTRGISVDGVSRSGYDRIVSPGNHVRQEWPDSFDFDEFLGFLYSRR